jgi:uncharacterized protein (UPF0332 family)
MKEQTKAYLEKAKKNIWASLDLIRNGHYEIAASRAYYAMFYTAEALLFEEGEEFSSHGAVHGAFGIRFAKTGRLDSKFHRYLIDAYRERQAADYDAPAEVGLEEAQALVDRAKEFLAAGETLLGR